MIVYFDTSAVVPLVVSEASTGVCQRLWQAADRPTTSLLTLVEAEAALAQASRMGRVSREQCIRASQSFSQLWREFTMVHPDEHLARQAVKLAHEQQLRGYNALHCATALAIADGEFVAASGDRNLIRAWKSLGLITADTSP